MELVLPDPSLGLSKEEAWDYIDRMIASIHEIGAAKGKKDYPTTHTFTEGLYCRQIFMPAGDLVISEVHNTQHQFVVLMGSISVWTHEKSWTRIDAPFAGVTEPGTRRILLIHSDCVFQTYHPTVDGETTHEQVEARILSNRPNPYLNDHGGKVSTLPRNSTEDCAVVS